MIVDDKINRQVRFEMSMVSLLYQKGRSGQPNQLSRHPSAEGYAETLISRPCTIFRKPTHTDMYTHFTSRSVMTTRRRRKYHHNVFRRNEYLQRVINRNLQPNPTPEHHPHSNHLLCFSLTYKAYLRRYKQHADLKLRQE